ncbi:hypothetical protein SDC9_101380 [bioreactor metagenome]|uniref:Uncharacterized protein n=1 Tax=bioreactor metagenome TaxID=1076179 RepID=A0A645AMX0_9ZZZZ
MATGQRFPPGIVEADQGCGCIPDKRCPHFNQSAAQAIRERCSDFCITERGRGSAAEGDRSVDATEPPLVLILHIGGIAITDDHQNQGILTVQEVIAQVEHRGKACVLSHADECSIQIDFKIALCAANGEYRFSCLPCFIEHKTGAVHSGGILFGGKGRSIGKGHDHIGVVRLVVPLHTP